MDSYNNSSNHHELDSVMGTMTRIPRLTSADGFSEWKFRIEKHIKLAEPIWFSSKPIWAGLDYRVHF